MILFSALTQIFILSKKMRTHTCQPTYSLGTGYFLPQSLIVPSRSIVLR